MEISLFFSTFRELPENLWKTFGELSEKVSARTAISSTFIETVNLSKRSTLENLAKMAVKWQSNRITWQKWHKWQSTAPMVRTKCLVIRKTVWNSKLEMDFESVC